MRRETLIVLLLVVFGFLFRLINLNQSFWLDEAAQVMESIRPLSEQLKITTDFHPPLFHILLHFWMYLGTSEVWVRLLSVFLGVGSIILLYQIAATSKDRKDAFMSALFLSISPYHLWYSQEARPYMLFVFLSLFSILTLIKKRWFLYSVVTTFLLYSLYFAPFLILGQLVYLYFFDRKSFSKFFLSLLLAILLFIPWLPEFSRQLGRGTSGAFTGWTDVVSVPPIKAIPLTLAKFILGKRSIDNLVADALVALPIFLLFVYGLWIIWKKKADRIIVILFVVPFITSVAVSFFIPVVAPQRLIFLLPFFLLITAKGIYNLPKVLRLTAIVIVMVTSMSGIVDYYTNPYTQREKWREAVSFVEQRTDRKALVLFVFPEPVAPYLWYRKGKVEAVGIAPKFKLQDEDLLSLSPRFVDKKRVYLFQYLTGLTDPQGKTHSFLEINGYKESFIKDFPGVGFIYIYERSD